MKTVAVIFGFLVLVYLVAWLSLLDLFALIGALLLIAAAAVGVGAAQKVTCDVQGGAPAK